MTSEQEKVLLENMDDIKRIVNKITYRSMTLQKMYDMEDLYQEAYIAYLNAYEHFDESKGVQFRTYASRAVCNQVMEVLGSKITRNGYREMSVEDFKTEFQTKSENGFENAEFRVWREQIVDYLDNLIQRYGDVDMYNYGLRAIKNDILLEDHSSETSNSELAACFQIAPRTLSLYKARSRKRFLETSTFRKMISV